MATDDAPFRFSPSPPACSGSTASSPILTRSSERPTIAYPPKNKYRPLRRIGPHEELRYYRPGGYHPVVVGDKLGHPDRFTVLGKLGSGTYGIVWLCWDAKDNKLRAVKVMQADHSEDAYGSEAALFSALSEGGGQVTAEEAYRNHLGVTLEHFWQLGPNGRHLCLVMPILGPNVMKAKALGDVDFLKDVCAQIVVGLAFLHGKGMVHADLHPANILFQTTLDDLGVDEAKSLLEGYGREPLVLKERDGLEHHGPEHIHECLKWDDVDPKYLKKEIVIIDFGSSFKTWDPPEFQTIHESLRAPEQFFGSFVSQGSDLWALGCTFMHVLGSNNPFKRFQSYDGKAWSPVPQWEYALGPLPQPYRARWIASKIGAKGAASKEKFESIGDSDPVAWTKEQLFADKQRRLEKYGTTDIYFQYLSSPTAIQVPASQQRQNQEGNDGAGGSKTTRDWCLPSGEIESAVSLIKSVIKYKPSDRTPARDLLAHPFLAGRRQHRAPPPSPSPSTDPDPAS